MKQGPVRRKAVSERRGKHSGFCEEGRKMGKKVITAGHICLDITPVFPAGKSDTLTDILLPGNLIQMEAADVHTGGAVANTGLAMKLLGAEVSLMGKVGTDTFGDMVCSILKKYRAEDGLIRVEGESTSYSVVLAVPGTDRIFLHHPGANQSFCAADVPADALKDTTLFHFGYPPLMRSMYDNDGEQLLTLMQKAKEAGAATSLDMAAVDETSDAGKADWDLILRRVLPFVDFFVPSAEELCFMLDKPRLKAWKERAAGKDITEILDWKRDIRPLADRCMAYGAKVLLIKCGAPGMYYRTAGLEKLEKAGERVEWNHSEWADREGFERSYVPDRILSGTGAGDTSIAAFLTAVLEGCPPETAMQLAAAAGASCVEAYDALGGLMPLDKLQEKIRAGWRKREIRDR